MNLTQTTFSGLPDQIGVTLSMGNEMVEFWSGNVHLIQLAREIVSGLTNPIEIAERVRLWVRENIEYRSDPAVHEMIQDPVVTLQTATGDCDDMAILAATLLGCIGHGCEIVSVTWKGRENEGPTHAVAKDHRAGVFVDPVAPCHVLDWPPYNFQVHSIGTA